MRRCGLFFLTVAMLVEANVDSSTGYACAWLMPSAASTRLMISCKFPGNTRSLTSAQNGETIRRCRFLDVAQDLVTKPIPVRGDIFEGHRRQSAARRQLHFAVLVAQPPVSRLNDDLAPSKFHFIWLEYGSPKSLGPWVTQTPKVGGCEPPDVLPDALSLLTPAGPDGISRRSLAGAIGQPWDGRSNLKESCEYGWVRDAEFFRLHDRKFGGQGVSSPAPMRAWARRHGRKSRRRSTFPPSSGFCRRLARVCARCGRARTDGCTYWLRRRRGSSSLTRRESSSFPSQNRLLPSPAPAATPAR